MAVKKKTKKTSKPKRMLPKRDKRGRFRSSPILRLKSVFRPRGKPSAATKQERKRTSKKNVDVKAEVRKGGATATSVETSYANIVNDGFDMREIGLINTTGGVDITVDRTSGSFAAHYSGKNRKGRHDIVVDPKYSHDSETLTHETVHILQEVDPKRPDLDRSLSVNKKGGLTPEERSLKEAMTEAESIGRQKKPDPNNASFYPRIDAKDPWSLKEQDINTIKGGRKGSLKGEAVGVVHDVFDKLHLSRYKEKDSALTAKQYKDRIRKKK